MDNDYACYEERRTKILSFIYNRKIKIIFRMSENGSRMYFFVSAHAILMKMEAKHLSKRMNGMNKLKEMAT